MNLWIYTTILFITLFISLLLFVLYCMGLAVGGKHNEH